MRLTTTSCPSIGLLLDNLASGYQRDIMTGADRAASQRGANLFVFVGGAFVDESLSIGDNVLFRCAGRPALDGVVAATSTLINNVGAEPGQRILQGLGVPCVSLGLPVEGLPSIRVDNRTGLAELCRHLAVDHGYRRFAMIAGPEHNDESRERITVCQTTLAEFGVSLGEDRITRQGFLVQSGKEGIKELFDKRQLSADKLDAIICANDLIAEGALLALGERRVRVPQDIALTGFDDLDRAQYLIPALSTVRQPVTELGLVGARTLLQSLDGVEVSLIVTLPSTCVVRSSCGCANGPLKASPTISPASRRGRALSGALQLMERRDLICAALSRAAAGQFAAAGNGWEGRWLLALFSDLGDPAERGFLAALELLLAELAEKRAELELCRDLLGILRDEALVELHDVVAYRRLEDILHAARALTSRTLERLEVNWRLLTTAALSGALFAVDRLMRLIGLEGFWEALQRELEGLGIHTCFVTQYSDEAFQSSVYLFGFSGLETIPPGLTGKAFPSRALLPAEICRRPRRYAIFARTLVAGQRAVGTVFLSLTADDIACYEPFASLIALELAAVGRAAAAGLPAARKS
jgi:sigma-B regulation protein RsbU (phosphoserine phosphatase)